MLNETMDGCTEQRFVTDQLGQWQAAPAIKSIGSTFKLFLESDPFHRSHSPHAGLATFTSDWVTAVPSY